MMLRDAIADLKVKFSLARSSARFFDRLQGFGWYKGLLDDWAVRIGVREGLSVLDAGCGPGRLSVVLAERGAEVLGVDRSEAMLKVARAQPRPRDGKIRFEHGDLMDLDVESGQFDVCLAASVVNIVPDAAGLLRELARVTRPGGYLSALVPTPRFRELQPVLRKSLQLNGFEAAALRAWSKGPPKMSAGEVQACFAAAGCGETHVNTYLQGAVISVTHQVVASQANG